jgi:dTDP-4-amino-4,6-dideoxygalactose transaminase
MVFKKQLMINVTQTFLPPLEEYTKIVKRAWDNNWLTNRGELLVELEQKLKNYLSISNIIITNNGTFPLQVALKLLGKGGEIITTPFSYVATTAAIVWENCTPVFVDIHPEYLTIDESKIEAAITEKTTAILATHVFGNPCNVEVIESIAKKHNISVIYDGAHAFGVKYKGVSIFEFGDVSTCSFHATKLFHTGEGGAMIAKDSLMNERLFYSHNFGHTSPSTFYGLGINGKTSELQAAMGLSVLPYIDSIFSERNEIMRMYNGLLNFNLISGLKIRENTEWNYSYFPVIFNSEDQLLRVLDVLNKNEIVPRRYFHPSLNTLPYLCSDEMPISESIASRVLCLPLYVGLSKENITLICELINKTI